MIILSKMFSRDREFIYFFMWKDSNRLNFLKFINYKIRNILFLRENNETSVWYEQKEVDEINDKIKDRINKDKHIIGKLINVLNKYWPEIYPYVCGKKEIQNGNQAKKYYNSLTLWWSGMTILFYIPDIKGIEESIKNKALEIRTKYQEYSILQSKPITKWWNKKYPKYKNLSSVITPKEFSKNTLTQKDISEIKKRLKGFALFNNKTYYLNQLYKELKKQNITLEKYKVEDKVKEIKGIIAFKGKIRGQVAIVKNKEDLKKVKEGMILVTEMTSPDMVPAMQRASAFVTNEGGITSHASIVARELKKPCIVGTKIATDALKDGELVEVDANNGIVKKI